ncbi:MAG TPA: tripartite tricarboxylate transporter substrate binding protein [Hyphomicrobiaceae bacterium]|nr:tripartite tricarboxylate transporter substrate binding protein [Hyphomicrobiaceae bacterium]
MGWRLALAALALSCVSLPTALAQEAATAWPTKPVRVLLGFGAGGGTDFVARITADRLSDSLGQQFVVENRPGAGGTIAGGMAAKSASDGYTALVISTGHSVSAVTLKQLPYDPVESFAPVGVLASSAYVVVVPKSSPATDLKSLVAYVNKAAGKLNYSTVTPGSTQHLIAEDLRQRTGMNAKHLSFRTTGEVITALLRGDAAYAVELIHAVRGQVQSGDLRLIAVSTPKRWPSAPNVPTLAESGLTGFAYSGWYGLLFPAGTPRPIIDTTHAALKKELAREDVQKKLEGAGAVVSLSSPSELGALIARDIANFRTVASKAGIQPK